jgi:DNA repair exonuclease SbcCD nuclease subunit
MLDVLEHAGLLKNVVKGRVINNLLMLDFIVDKKTGAKITGMLGKKGMLEKSYYEALDREALESEPGFKIFMFHTALTELKPEDLSEMESSPISLLPKGFDYYAGGHVHIVAQKTLEGYGLITYPGPLFPNSFKELEELKSGGFFIWDERAVSYHSIPLFNVISANIECQHKSPLGVRQELIKHAEQILSEIKSYAAHAIGSQKPTIVLLRFVGMMASGKISEIEMNDIFDRLYDNGVYYIMKNTHKLTTKEYEEVKISIEKSNDVEDALITEHMGEHAKHNLCFVGGGNRVGDNSPTDDNTSKEKAFEDGKTLIKEIIHALDLEKQEGERVVDFEQRVKDNVSRIVKFS